ncbi:MAG: hypothetical protein HYS32_03715 [Candidatus Woesearchaeota archaeon]|nr:MAG: hypothetical protein HYS32_03715 [Candidatus Woesearchaeota archaeon]
MKTARLAYFDREMVERNEGPVVFRLPQELSEYVLGVLAEREEHFGGKWGKMLGFLEPRIGNPRYAGRLQERIRRSVGLIPKLATIEKKYGIDLAYITSAEDFELTEDDLRGIQPGLLQRMPDRRFTGGFSELYNPRKHVERGLPARLLELKADLEALAA